MAEIVDLGAALLVAAVVLGFVWLRRQSSKESVPDTPDRVLGEAKIYTSYGREKQAIKTLEDGLKRFPGDIALQSELDRLLSVK